MHIPKGLTVEIILEQVKNEFCNDYCKYTGECTEKMDNGEELRPCPLDKL